jgi:hypothetical protein
MSEDQQYIEITGTTSVKGAPRPVYLTAGQPGRVTMTILVGEKSIVVVLPIQELRQRLDEIDRR